MTEDVTTAAIIGSNWGLIHLNPLRSYGVQVETLFDLDLSIAQKKSKELSIPTGTNQLENVEGPDIVVIATPAQTHVDLINRFQNSFIICEKPLIGWQGDSKPLPRVNNRIWVNYAFPHLEDMRSIQAILADEDIQEIRLNSSVNLPLQFSLEQWFLETASHPLSGLLNTLGEPKVISRNFLKTKIQITLIASRTPIHIEFEMGGREGIFHEMKLIAKDKVWLLPAQYEPGQNWKFGPITLNDEHYSNHEETKSDPWLDANAQSIQQLLNVYTQRLTTQQAKELGSFDVEKSLWIEDCLSSSYD
jgi:dTDP-4-dehydrorhamnose reductase